MNDIDAQRPDVVRLRERLAPRVGAVRRARALAGLSIHMHPQRGVAAPPDGVVPQLERELERRIHGCLGASDSLAVLGGLRFAALLERPEQGPFAMHAADLVVQAVGGLATLGATPL